MTARRGALDVIVRWSVDGLRPACGTLEVLRKPQQALVDDTSNCFEVCTRLGLPALAYLPVVTRYKVWRRSTGVAYSIESDQ